MTVYFIASEFTMFIIVLSAFLALVFGALYLSYWIRRRLIWRRQPETVGVIGEKVFGATVHDLVKGERYVVVKDFTDYYGAEFKRGETLTYQKLDFLPYHDGYTLNFAARTIYLQGEANAEFLQNTNRYLQPPRKTSGE